MSITRGHKARLFGSSPAARCIFALLAGAASATQAAPNLLVNGGFETGNFTGWTLSDLSLTVAASDKPHTGTFEADLGNRSLSTLQQSVTTVVGAVYTVDLWIGRLGPLAGGDQFSLSVSFAGTSFVNLTSSTLPLNSPYAEYSANITAATTNSALVISYVDQPSYTLIDDVSVTAAVPEPSEAALLLAGLVMVGSAAFKQRMAGARGHWGAWRALTLPGWTCTVNCRRGRRHRSQKSASVNFDGVRPGQIGSTFCGCIRRVNLPAARATGCGEPNSVWTNQRRLLRAQLRATTRVSPAVANSGEATTAQHLLFGARDGQQIAKWRLIGTENRDSDVRRGSWAASRSFDRSTV